MKHRQFIGAGLAVLLHLLAYSLEAQPVPAEIKSIVAYIYVPGTKDPVAAGTAFFVGVKHPAKEEFSTYLVTAKHVLQMKDKQFFPRVWVRLNKLDGKSAMIALDLQTVGPKKNVYAHADTGVDIAVVRGAPDQAIYNYRFVPDRDITSKDDIKQLRVTEGSEVFFTGLFTAHAGDDRTSPIVRFGRVALMTDERIKWGDEGKLQLYIVESGSYGGNSGSPVIFFLSPEHIPGTFGRLASSSLPVS